MVATAPTAQFLRSAIGVRREHPPFTHRRVVTTLAVSERMLAQLRTAALVGIEAVLVQVEVDVSFGMPDLTVVGLPDASVRESRDRVRAAIRNSGFDYPPHRVTVNLAPADLRKVGSAFDLPIAIGILAAAGQLVPRLLDDVLLVGELSLDGAIQPIRGVLPAVVAATRGGITSVLLAAANAGEAAIVPGARVLAASTLAEAVTLLQSPATAPPVARPAPRRTSVRPGPLLDLADVRGQPLARRALEIAAAGGHHLLLSGPPGCGKTMLARRLPGLLPDLTFEAALEVSAVHSVSGLLGTGAGLMLEPPFRAPHHTISDVALVGGGALPRPGEISLAHHGVLFLDELPEFSRRALEVLRQPIEAGYVTVSRAARTAHFPARFLLVAAMNPCPCGRLGHPRHACRCTPLQVHRYAGRVSAPLRDRLDLTADVPPLSVVEMNSTEPGESTLAVRGRVAAARVMQAARLAGLPGPAVNAGLSGAALREHGRMTRDARRLLVRAAERLELSARAHDRVVRVARTIADLESATEIAESQIAEALQFRGSPF
jgi:magnesium chelatase family protein